MDYDISVPATYYGPRIFPEYYAPPELVAGQKDHLTVDVKITLAMPVPQGWVADLYLRDHDVDHGFNATKQADAGTDFLDPNDEVIYNPVYPAPAPFPVGSDNLLSLVRRPEDNRGLGGLNKGAALFDDHLEIAAGETSNTAGYFIYAPQPGNNYRVSVSGHESVRDRYTIARDAITIFTAPHHDPAVLEVPIPPQRVTDTLTVWRTLHIERDSMGTPPTGHVFDPIQPVDDKPPNPLDIRDAHIDLLAEWYLPANIVVMADLDTYDVKDGFNADPTLNFFIHNIETAQIEVGPPLGAARSKIDAMRDVLNGALFWSVQVIGAYEGPIDKDFDDPEPEPGSLAGQQFGTAERPFCLIYLETIRDRTAHVSAAFPQTFGGPDADTRALIYERRTVVHEVGHTFLGSHSGIAGTVSETRIMGPAMETESDEWNRFSARQLGVIQSQPRPKG